MSRRINLGLVYLSLSKASRALLEVITSQPCLVSTRSRNLRRSGWSSTTRTFAGRRSILQFIQKFPPKTFATELFCCSFLAADRFKELLPYDLTGHLVKDLSIRGLSKEPQRDLKSAFVFDVSAAVVGLPFFIAAEGFLQKSIGIDGVTPGAD